MLFSFFQKKSKNSSSTDSTKEIEEEIFQLFEKIKEFYSNHNIEKAQEVYTKVLDKYKMLLYTQEELYTLEYIEVLLFGAKHFPNQKEMLLEQARLFLANLPEEEAQVLHQQILQLQKDI